MSRALGMALGVIGIKNNQPNPPLNSLDISWWKLDEPGGTRADSWGSNTLTDPTGTGSATGFSGRAARFVSGDRLAITDNASLSPGDADFQIILSAWLDSKAVEASFVYKWPREYIVQYSSADDRFSFLVSSDGATFTKVLAQAIGSPSTGTWYQIRAMHDVANNRIGIQVNNGTVTWATHNNGAFDSSAEFRLGNSLAGRVDNVIFSKRLWTDAEYTRWYNGGNPLSSSLIALPGVWTWFNDPRAFRYGAQSYIATINKAGAETVYQYNHTTQAWSEFVLKTGMPVDDHNNPAIIMRDSDKKLLAFYTGHNVAYMYLRISTNAEDATAWEAEVDLDAQLGGSSYAYVNPIQLTGETNDPIYLFFRDSNGPMYFSVSSDGGSTWAAMTQLLSGGRAYVREIANGTDRIDFAMNTGHPNDVVGASIHHMYYQGGAYYQSDGTEITGGLPLDVTDGTLVYDGTSVEGWVWDIAIDQTGKPIIVFATFPTPATDHRYNYARWTGSAWDVHEICTAGGRLFATETYYSGGVALDHNDPNIVYASRNLDTTWEMWKFITADGGATWTGSQITSGSTAPNIRPVGVRGSTPGDLDLVWCAGSYTSYTIYNTSVISNTK